MEYLTERMRDLEVAKSSSTTLSRSILGAMPSVKIDGPKTLDQFECNENDKDSPIRFDGVQCPYFCEELRSRRGLNFDLLEGFATFERKDHNKLELGERVLWLEAKLKKNPEVPLKEVTSSGP